MATVQHIFVVDRAELSLVLGQPFIYWTMLTFSYREEGQFATLVDDKRTKQVTVKVAEGGPMRTEREVFPGNG